jgi:Tol biopolymer transport system component
VEQVGRFEIGDYAFFSVSANGVLAYQGVDEGATRLQWFDRDGKMVAAAAPPGAYNTLTLSPDGARLVAERQDSRASDDLWMIEFARSTSTRLTFDPGRDLMPVWSPDGARVAYVSRRGGGDGLYRKLSNLTGNEELLWQSNSQKFLNDWSRDGRFLLFSQQDPKTGYDLWLLPLAGANGAPGKPEEFLHTEFGETQGQFSPDMRWVAYTSNESGRQEIYVRPFPRSETGGKTTVSTGGGSQPRWRKDGKELFYLTEQGVMVVDVTANPAFKSSAPKPAVRAQLANMLGGANVFLWDVAPDGEHFLINMVGERSSAPVTVVLNWQAGLKK